MANLSPPHVAAQDGAPPVTALGADEAWHLVAPWLGHVFLAVAAVLGLFTASGDADSVTYGAGLATSFIAVVVIFVRIKRQFDGQTVGFLLPVASASADSLFVTIAMLGILGIAGAVLAATVGGTLYGIGLALFIVSAALIFGAIKRYFDLQERGG